RRTALPRVRGDAQRGDRHLARRLAHDHADDVREVPHAARPAETWTALPLERERIRPPPARIRARARLRPRALAAGAAGHARDDRLHGLSLRDHSERLLPAAGDRKSVV